MPNDTTDSYDETDLAPPTESDTDTEQPRLVLDDGLQNIQAEQAILACLMQDETAWDQLTGLLEESDFFDFKHRTIFATIRVLANKNQSTDEISIINALKDANELSKAGGSEYVGGLIFSLHDRNLLQNYRQIVRSRSIRRELIRASNHVRALATQPHSRSLEEILAESEEEILGIGNRVIEDDNLTTLSDNLNPLLEQIREMERLGGRIPGIESGFPQLDDLTSGFRDNDLIIVAARPGMGKTALALNVCTNVALNTGKPILFFSLEQDRDQLFRRIFSSVAGVSYSKLDRGEDLSAKDWQQLESARHSLAQTEIFVVDKPSTTVEDMRAHIRRINRTLASESLEHGSSDTSRLAMVVVDYLQLVTPVTHYTSRVIELGGVSRALKAMAKEFKIPVISVAQLNRNVENRENKRPRMADLRDSGEIEQDADLILFIYRDEVYDSDSLDKGKAEIIVGKHRNGPCGDVMLEFQGNLMKFSNAGEEAYRANVSYVSPTQHDSPASAAEAPTGRATDSDDPSNDEVPF